MVRGTAALAGLKPAAARIGGPTLLAMAERRGLDHRSGSFTEAKHFRWIARGGRTWGGRPQTAMACPTLHSPPHFHALYGDFEATIDFEKLTGRLILCWKGSRRSCRWSKLGVEHVLGCR